jgi:hypothetical protein
MSDSTSDLLLDATFIKMCDVANSDRPDMGVITQFTVADLRHVIGLIRAMYLSERQAQDKLAECEQTLDKVRQCLTT